MRIGVLTTSYPRWPGDSAGQFVAALNRSLVDAGHQVEVLAAGPAPEPVPAEVAQGVSPQDSGPGMTEDPALRVRRVSSSLFYAGGAPDALARGGGTWREAARFSMHFSGEFLALQRRYDGFVSHWLVPCGVLAALAAGNRPHVAVAHSSDVHLLRQWRGQGLVRWLARRARLVYTASSLTVPGAQGHVVPMGVDCAQFAASPEQRRAARAELGVQRPTILFLGRLVPVKGVDVLLRALAGLPDATLWIAGDGPLRSALQAQARGLGHRVQFLGPIAGAERRRRLLACDVLALPSIVLPDGRTEGAPQVVLEGLAAGSRVVASRVGGVADLLGDAGWCVPPGDVSACIAALRAALACCDEPQRQRAVAQAQRFDWSLIAPRIIGATFGARHS